MRLERFENEKKPKIMIIPMIDIIFFPLGIFHDEYAQHGYTKVHRPKPAAGFDGCH